MPRFIHPTSAVVALLLASGCSAATEAVEADPEPISSTPTATCSTAVSASAVEADPGEVGAALSASLDACGSAVEWLAAVHEVDGAMVWESDEAALSVLCWAWPDTAVCFTQVPGLGHRGARGGLGGPASDEVCPPRAARQGTSR